MIDFIYNWAYKKRRQGIINKFGGIQTCPYCLQIAQQNDDWSFIEYEKDPFLDVLQCGVCGGRSLWKFEVGYFYIGPHTAPMAKHDSCKYYDLENSCLKMSYFLD